MSVKSRLAILIAAAAALTLALVVVIVITISKSADADAELERIALQRILEQKSKTDQNLPAKKPSSDVPLTLDAFGNPVEDVGLARKGEFQGKRILAWSAIPDVHRLLFADTSPLWNSLRGKGFVIDLKRGAFETEWLQNADQLWIFSGGAPLTDATYDAIVAFAQSGKGLYLLSDDEPLVTESDALARRLFNAGVKGNYPAGKIAAVRGRRLTEEDRARFKADFEVDDHPLLTGLNFLWEGVTVSHVDTPRRLTTVMPASDGKTLIAVPDSGKPRVVIDCGWTRYYPMFLSRGAGTIRLAENVAAFLSGKERAD